MNYTLLDSQDADTFSQIPTFIRLVGNPPPQKHGDQIDCISKIGSEYLIDIIDTSTEDPFTLESFYDLLVLHLEYEKDFLIARVLTEDGEEKKDARNYYSYYCAHQINKVLFRTQPELGLLHRIKANNVSCLFARMQLTRAAVE